MKTATQLMLVFADLSSAMKQRSVDMMYCGMST